jgi:hypothetical protein
MKPFLFCAFFTLISSTLFAQPTQTVRGKVFDSETNFPLLGAKVEILTHDSIKKFRALSNEEGLFVISAVPVGKYQVEVKLATYETKMITVEVNSGKEAILNIPITERIIEQEEVTIVGRKKGEVINELAVISAQQFSVEETNRYPGSRMDPARMASNFAGVQGADDSRNDIVIRGNSPLGLLWRLEGADIPNPNHFSNQGANGGPVSILNNNTLANSDFLTGAFPAEYGNANAGVFDLKIRNGNNEKHEFIGQIGFNGLELLAEGPIKNGQSSYLASYRYSTLSFFDAIGFKFGDSGIPFYQDATFKVSMPNTKTGNWSVWGIGGTSSTKLLDSDKTAEDRKKEAQPQDIDFTSKMGV